MLQHGSMRREELDQIAWQTIHEHPRPAGKPRGVAYTNRPANFRELVDLMGMGVDFELAWSEFLHEFMFYRSVSFFADPPPAECNPEFKALCAGTAEVLCDEFRLPVPIWVHLPEFTLAEPWEPYGWMYPEDDPAFYKRRIERADPLFLKHNVVWERRNLITL